MPLASVYLVHVQEAERLHEPVAPYGLARLVELGGEVPGEALAVLSGLAQVHEALHPAVCHRVVGKQLEVELVVVVAVALLRVDVSQVGRGGRL